MDRYSAIEQSHPIKRHADQNERYRLQYEHQHEGQRVGPVLGEIMRNEADIVARGNERGLDRSIGKAFSFYCAHLDLRSGDLFICGVDPVEGIHSGEQRGVSDSTDKIADQAHDKLAARRHPNEQQRRETAQRVTG